MKKYTDLETKRGHLVDCWTVIEGSASDASSGSCPAFYQKFAYQAGQQATILPEDEEMKIR